jgi:hypothetical protein
MLVRHVWKSQLIYFWIKSDWSKYRINRDNTSKALNSRKFKALLIGNLSNRREKSDSLFLISVYIFDDVYIFDLFFMLFIKHKHKTIL